MPQYAKKTYSVNLKNYEEATKYQDNRGKTKMVKILFICHGNICRSPMAEFIMKATVREAGLTSAIQIDSAAVSREEIETLSIRLRSGSCARTACRLTITGRGR